MQCVVYVLTRSDEVGYDEFISCVVVHHSEDLARLIHPDSSIKWTGDAWRPEWRGKYYDTILENCHGWVMPHNVSVKRVGVADEGFEAGSIICTSFNAG